MHLKRMKVSKMWPIARKGKKFVVRPMGELDNGIPLLIVLREMLKLGRNRDEVEQILNKGNIQVNGKVRKEEKLAIKAFDVISIKSINKTYSLIVNKFKRFELAESKEGNRINKITGKRMLKNGKKQINLMNGSNFIVSENVKVGDSVAISIKDGKIEKIIPLKEGSKIIVIKGKHIGAAGKIKEIKEKDAIVSIEKEDADIKLENLMAI